MIMMEILLLIHSCNTENVSNMIITFSLIDYKRNAFSRAVPIINIVKICQNENRKSCESTSHHSDMPAHNFALQ